MWPFKRKKTITPAEVAKQLHERSARKAYRDIEEFSGSLGWSRARDSIVAIVENERRHCRIGKIILK